MYWLARMIEGGADPIFIARRLAILRLGGRWAGRSASDGSGGRSGPDHALDRIARGTFPAGPSHDLSGAAPKSNKVMTAYTAAAADAAASAREPVPLHLRNAVTSLLKGIGYGGGYRYIHDDPAAQAEMRCLRSGLKAGIILKLTNLPRVTVNADAGMS